MSPQQQDNAIRTLLDDRERELIREIRCMKYLLMLVIPLALGMIIGALFWIAVHT